jgi:hypothetical protein
MALDDARVWRPPRGVVVVIGGMAEAEGVMEMGEWRRSVRDAKRLELIFRSGSDRE